MTFHKPLIASALALLLGACATSDFDFGGLNGAERYATPSHFGNYLAARQAQYDGDTEAAARLYRRSLLASEEPDPEILERTYVLDVSNGNVERAASLAAMALLMDEDNAFARMTLAVHQMGEGRYVPARVNLEGMNEGPLTTLSGTLLQAWAIAGTGDYDAARDFLSNTPSLEGTELFQLYHNGLLADLAGDEGEAEISYVTAITASGGSSARLIESYGSFLERHDRQDEAIRVYDAFLDLAPQNPLILDARARAERGGRAQPTVASANDGAAEALFSVASVIAGEISYDVPILYLRLALHLRPDLAPAHMLLGELYSDADMNERAVEAYEGVPQNSPLRDRADLQRALALNDLGRTDEGIRVLNRLARDDEDSFEAWLTLGDALRMDSRFDEAVDAYVHAMDLKGPDQPHHWVIYYTYGIALEQSGRWPEAEAAFLHALQLQEDQPYVLNYLGYSWIEQGVHLERALEMLHRAVEQEPLNGLIIDSLGWAYYQLGRYDEAVNYLEVAAELEPGDATVNDHLGDAYWRAGREREARFQWSHALNMDPDEEQLEDLNRKLAEGLDARPATAVNNGGI